VDTCAAPLRYCESWLVDHGRSRLLDAHAARMAASLRPYGVPRTDVLAALLALVDAVPDDGQWFPRLEWCGEHFHQRVRRLGDGAVRSTARLVTGGPDPRVQPRHKGPDFDTQDKLRAYAVQHGGDDALLVDAAGAVTESAYGSVLWWRDGALYTPDTDQVLPGITRAAVLRLAAEDAVAVRRAPIEPAALVDVDEIWLLSALHGIRQVVALDGRTLPAPSGSRRPDWQRRLTELARPAPMWRDPLTASAT